MGRCRGGEQDLGLVEAEPLAHRPADGPIQRPPEPQGQGGHGRSVLLGSNFGEPEADITLDGEPDRRRLVADVALGRLA